MSENRNLKLGIYFIIFFKNTHPINTANLEISEN